MWTWKDKDSMERVLEASSEEILCGSLHPGKGRSAGLVAVEATPVCRAVADCSVGVAPWSHCWESGMVGLYEDTGIQRRQGFLCPQAQRELNHRRCSIQTCCFL